MQRERQPGDTIPSGNERKYTTLHACSGEYENLPGFPGHWDTCTSALKFSNTWCCGSGNTPRGDRPRCGHGPRSN